MISGGKDAYIEAHGLGVATHKLCMRRGPAHSTARVGPKLDKAMIAW